MSVLSQTMISTGGVLSCSSAASWMYLKRSTHWPARVLQRSLGLAVDDLRLGLRAAGQPLAGLQVLGDVLPQAEILAARAGRWCR